MTPRQIAFRKSLLACIHMLKAPHPVLGEDGVWRDTLEDVFGVRSSALLSIDDLIAVKEYLEGKTETLKKKLTPKALPRCATNRQLYTMRGLWQSVARNPEERALLEFVYRICKKAYVTLEAMQSSEAQKVINALKRMDLNLRQKKELEN